MSAIGQPGPYTLVDSNERVDREVRVLREAALEAREMRPSRRPARGSAIIAVVIISLLVGTLGVGIWSLTRLQLLAAQRRVAYAQAAEAASASVRAAAAWFDEFERGSLIGAPDRSQVDRELRVIDEDGDGAGPRWNMAAPPWNVRYKETSAGPPDLFRPPDDTRPENRFVGTPDGPDVLLSAAGGDVPPPLEALSAALAPGLPIRVIRIALFRPPDRAGPFALATLEAVVEARLPGSAPVRARARAEVIRVPWGRADRPLVLAGDLTIDGSARWSHGEALVEGALVASSTAAAGWPGGIPWVAPDRPLRIDNGGDGTADDLDGDGSDDWSQWAALPGLVGDPWWRGRFGGGWSGVVGSPASCEQPYPFGPRAVPPAAPSKSAERSGLFLGCPAPAPIEPLPRAWIEIAQGGLRGAWTAIEVDGALGQYRRNGRGPARPLEELLPRGGGVVLVAPAASRTEPVSIDADGVAGAVLLRGADLDVAGAWATEREIDLPGDPADTAGASRAALLADDALAVSDDTGGCAGWSIGTWNTGGDPVEGRFRHSCPPRPIGFAGLIAGTGRLTLRGPLVVAGQIRGGDTMLDGRAGPVRVLAVASSPESVERRPGPPGAPRTVVSSLRVLP